MISREPPKLEQNAPVGACRLTGLQHDQAVAAAESIRRTGHRFDGEAAPPATDVGDGVRRVDHEEPVDRLHPEGQARVARRGLEMDPDQSVAVWYQGGERGIYAEGPDRPQFKEVEGRATIRQQATGWDQAIVGLEPQQRRHL